MPAELRPLLAAERLEDVVGVTFLMLTAGPEGWPHIALLSAGELLWTAPDRLRAALWRDSSTTSNLERSGMCTIALVHDAAAHYLRCRARRGVDLAVPGGALARFELRLVEARRDVADYAELTSGITFRLPHPERVLPRWRETIRLLREAGPDSPVEEADGMGADAV